MQAVGRADRADVSKTNAAITITILVLVMGLLVAVLVAVAIKSQQNLGPEIALPVIAISDLLVLLVALGIVAIAFQRFQLADQRQALALPEGSVRAVIALALVVLFAILTVFLYGDLAQGHSATVSNLTSDQKDQMIKNIPAMDLISIDGPHPDKTFAVQYRAHSLASEDFAKQLLVMIGTLMTAVASFYFGAKTASSSQAATAEALKAAPALSVTTISPARTQAGNGLTSVKVGGTGLNDVVKLRLRKAGFQDIPSENAPTSSDSLVLGTLMIGAATPQGPWDVVVADKAGREATGTALFIVDAPPSANGSRGHKVDNAAASADTPAETALEENVVAGANVG